MFKSKFKIQSFINHVYTMVPPFSFRKRSLNQFFFVQLFSWQLSIGIITNLPKRWQTSISHWMTKTNPPHFFGMQVLYSLNCFLLNGGVSIFRRPWENLDNGQAPEELVTLFLFSLCVMGSCRAYLKSWLYRLWN